MDSLLAFLVVGEAYGLGHVSDLRWTHACLVRVAKEFCALQSILVSQPTPKLKVVVLVMVVERASIDRLFVFFG